MKLRHCDYRLLVGSFLLLVAAVSGCAAQTQVPAPPPSTPLDSYIARPEPSYKWEKTGQTASSVDLRVTTQQWQGKPWTHHVQIFKPKKNDHPDTALLLISYGSGSELETFFGQVIANTTGITFVNLFDVPNEPLYGKEEDDLIAYTFEQYLQTGDESWPLLFPMTKSVVKTMDAVGEFSKQEWGQPITKFGVSGVSKRGWTTWLCAAADKRVIGIVPIVYDNLNLGKQLPHQLESWGAYSEQIHDYTSRGLEKTLTTPQGQKLAAMVDPWSLRDRITVPKLIINAANDRYRPLDSLNIYRGDLKGETDVMYVPNAGHMMGGKEREVFGSAVAWFKHIVNNEQVPTVSLIEIPPTAGGMHSFVLRTAPSVKTAQLWVARSQTRDFRKSRWEPLLMESDKAGQFEATVPALNEPFKYLAVFGDIQVPASAMPLHLSSSVILREEK